MDDSDKKEFAILFYGTGELYDKAVTKNLLQIYFDALKGFTIEQVKDGVSKHALDPKHGTFFPKPADIVRHLQVDEPSAEEKAELAWAQVLHAMRKHGSYGSLELDDKQALAAVKSFTTWKDLCMTPETSMTWAKKEFISMYSTYEKTPVEMLPSSLPGREALIEHKQKSSAAMVNIINGIENHRANIDLDDTSWADNLSLEE